MMNIERKNSSNIAERRERERPHISLSLFGGGAVQKEISAAEKEFKRGVVTDQTISLLMEKTLQENIKFDKTDYKKFVEVHDRDEKELATINTGVVAMHKELKESLPDKIKMFMDDKKNWLFLQNNQREQGAKKEVRVYLSVKGGFMPLFSKRLFTQLHKLPAFRSMKMNISNKERRDNLVLYFSENATAKEIEGVITVIEQTMKENNLDDEAFHNYSIKNPWDINIHYSPSGRQTSPTKKVGALTYYPARSSSSDVKLTFFPNTLQAQNCLAETPNDLLSVLIKKGNEEMKNHSREELVSFLLQTKVLIRTPEFNAKDTTLKEYIKQNLLALTKIINSEQIGIVV